MKSGPLMSVPEEEGAAICRELELMTDASDVRMLCAFRSHGHLRYILSAGLDFADCHVRYFFAYFGQSGFWYRANFEGKVEDILSELAIGPQTPEGKAILAPRTIIVEVTSSTWYRDLFGFWNISWIMLSFGHQHTASEAPLAIKPQKPSMKSAFQETDPSGQSHFLRLPRELRDVVYSDICSDVFVLYHQQRTPTQLSSPNTKIVTSRGLPGTNRQIRAEFNDHLLRTKATLPGLKLLAATDSIDWNQLIPVTAPAVCQFSAVLSRDEIQRLYDTASEAVASVSAPQDITFLLNCATSHSELDDLRFLPGLPDELPDQIRLRYIFKRDLLLLGEDEDEGDGDDGCQSGFTAFYDMYDGDVKHILRTDDFAGFLDILRDFDKPSAGEKILKRLAWCCCHMAGITRAEQQVLQRAIPPVERDVRFWTPTFAEEEQA